MESSTKLSCGNIEHVNIGPNGYEPLENTEDQLLTHVITVKLETCNTDCKRVEGIDESSHGDSLESFEKEEDRKLQEDEYAINAAIKDSLSLLAPEKMDSICTNILDKQKESKEGKDLDNTKSGITSSEISFKKNYSLERQTRKRRADPINCDTCRKSFRTSNSLNKHACKPTIYVVDPCKVGSANSSNGQITIEIGANSIDVNQSLSTAKYELNYVGNKVNRTLIKSGDFKPVPRKTSKRDTCKNSVPRPLARHIPDTCGTCQKHFKECTCDTTLKFVCDKCHKSFKLYSALLRHIGQCPSSANHNRSLPKVYECDTCHRAYKNRSVIVKHLQLHSEGRPCPVCSKRFRQGDALRRHMFTHTDTKPAKCGLCSKEFGYQSSLKRHLLTHTDIKPFRCDICLRTFIESCALKKHVLTHTDKKRYKCRICLKRFPTATDLKEHSDTHTQTESQSLKCDICHTDFNNLYQLHCHTRTHHNDKPNKCNLCDKSFSKPCHLRDHIATHSGVKPYQCDICSKGFTERSNLLAHIKRHAGIKRYSEKYTCSVCGKFYSHPSALATHMHNHTGNRPFKCQVCPKTFAYQSLLELHNKAHVTVKSFHCQYCEKSFKYACGLKKHIRNKH